MSTLINNTEKTIANSLIEHKGALAKWVTDRYFQAHPELAAQWGNAGKQRCMEDAAYHFAYLAEAIRFNFPVLFTDYVGWSKILLYSLNIRGEHLEDHLSLLVPAIENIFSSQTAEVARPFVDRALAEFPHMPSTQPTFLLETNPHLDLARKWLETLLKQQARESRQLIRDSIQQNIATIPELYEFVFTPSLQEIGRLWQLREISEAEEHYCSQATETMVAMLSAQFEPRRIRKTIVGFCVGNEFHEIGLRFVVDCFTMHGWDAVSLGSNVPTRNIDRVLRIWEPDVIAISATMTYHLSEVEKAIEAIRAAEIPQKPRILVGGRPFNICPGLGERIGADASGCGCSELISKTTKALAA